jgi:hypothetical protein
MTYIKTNISTWLKELDGCKERMDKMQKFAEKYGFNLNGSVIEYRKSVESKPAANLLLQLRLIAKRENSRALIRAGKYLDTGFEKSIYILVSELKELLQMFKEMRELN